MAQYRLSFTALSRGSRFTAKTFDIVDCASDEDAVYHALNTLNQFTVLPGSVKVVRLGIGGVEILIATDTP